MIRAVTAARMIMTVVMLFGEKKKGQHYHTAHLFHTLHLQCMSAEPPAGRRMRQVCHRHRPRWSSEARDHNDHTSDKHSGEHSSSKVRDHGVGEDPGFAFGRRQQVSVEDAPFCIHRCISELGGSCWHL